MRNFIDLITETVDKDTAPPTHEDGDHEHYQALEKTGFFGNQAAGAVLMSKTTGRIMLVLRSQQVLESGTWGNCGGAHKDDERPIDAAKREVYEETGYNGSVEMIPLLVFKKPNFKYENFLALVEEEFVPELGWEADEHKWATLDTLPSPLHFGITALLNDANSLKVIKHYAGLFDDELSEDVNVNAVLAVAKKTAAKMKAEGEPEEEAPDAPDNQEKKDLNPTSNGSAAKKNLNPS